jgi:hypothetical protein
MYICGNTFHLSTQHEHLEDALDELLLNCACETRWATLFEKLESGRFPSTSSIAISNVATKPRWQKMKPVQRKEQYKWLKTAIRMSPL